MHLTVKLLGASLVVWIFVLPLIPGMKKAATELRSVDPLLLLLGVVLEFLALFCYSLLTKAALGVGGHDISRTRLFRIQMSTRALSSIVPGGSAADALTH